MSGPADAPTPTPGPAPRVGVFQNRLGFDGRTRMLNLLLARLAALGADTTLVHYERNPLGTLLREEVEAGIAQVVVPRRPGGPRGHLADQLRSGAALPSLAAPYDALFLHDSLPLRRAPGRRVGHLVCLPLPSTLRFEERFQPWGRWAAPVATHGLRHVARRATAGQHLAANSHFGRAELAAWLGDDEREIDVLWPSLADDDFPADEVVGSAGDRDPARALVLGRIHTQKLDLGLLDGLLAAVDDLRVDVAGQVDDAELAAELARRPRVTVVPHPSEPARRALLASASYLVHCRQYEHFGLSPIEAAAAGCIPVVPDNGGCRETVTDARLRYGSPIEAARALRWLRDDAEARTRLRHELAADVRARFSEAAVTPAYDRYLSRLLA